MKGRSDVPLLHVHVILTTTQPNVTSSAGDDIDGAFCGILTAGDRIPPLFSALDAPLIKEQVDGVEHLVPLAFLPDTQL